jgi:hypothetical protein
MLPAATNRATAQRLGFRVTNVSRPDHSLPAPGWLGIFPLPRSGVL